MRTYNLLSVFLLIFPLLGVGQLLETQRTLRPIQILEVQVKGNRSVDASLVRGAVSVKKGEEYLPNVLRQKVRESITNLHKLELFSDVVVHLDAPDTLEGVILTFDVVELPTLAKVEIKGQKKLDEDDIREVVDLLDGQVYSQSAVTRNVQKVVDLYKEKGYLLAEVDVKEVEEEKTGRYILQLSIDEGRKVRVREIDFVGNGKISDKKLKKQMDTKEKRWWRSGEFKSEEFRSSLDSVVSYYKDEGFLDASVTDHDIQYSEDRKYMDITVNVNEGRKYFFGKARFIGNDIVEDEKLESMVLLDSGDVFNQTVFEATRQNVQSVYLEQGYLQMRMEDQKSYDDSIVSVTFQIAEGGISHIHKVLVRGNTKTKDKVIRREIDLFPGDVFRLSLLQRSARDIMQLNYFDNVVPNFEAADTEDKNDVNLVFDVMEKKSGTGTFSAGMAFSARERLVGTLGLQIPNFLGNGQRADMSLEYGRYRRFFSIGFTEPWLLDMPTLVGGSVFYEWRQSVDQRDLPFKRYGFRTTLGRRLTWPDDYFSVRGTYNLTINENGLLRDPRYLVLRAGLESSLGVTLVRDDKDLPVFPTEGSRYQLTYNLVGGPLGGDFDYRQYEAKVNWWFPAFSKFVLGIEMEAGIINGENIQRIDLYQMGGTLGYEGKLRGYAPGSIGFSRVGRSFFSLVTELSYPVVENTFYLLGFFDAGNVFGNLALNDTPIPKELAGSPLEEIDLSNLKKDVGVGVRLMVPMVGILGFDFGWPLDLGEDYTTGRPIDPKNMQFNFVIEPPF